MRTATFFRRTGFWSLEVVCAMILLGLPSPNTRAQPIQRGLSFAEHFEDLPYFKKGVQTYQFSSTDPAEDQFEDFSHWLRTDDRGGAVLADIYGPGSIYRIWSTGNDGASNRIQVYLDGQATAVIDETLDSFHGHPPLRDKPQVGSGGDKYLAWWSYLPIPFEKSCRIVRIGNFRPFYNITYHTYTDAQQVKSWTGRENLTRLENLWTHPEVDPKTQDGNVVHRVKAVLQPGESVTVFDQKGQGHIASLKIAQVPPQKEVRLKIYWDGQSTPAVDAPVKGFFGSVDNGGDLRALGIGTSGSHGYCYFPMPFWRQAKIELVNASDRTTREMEVEIQYNPRAYPETAAGYFRTFANESVQPGHSYTCLKAHGRGHVVGMAKRMPAGGHACEGDEIYYIDGRLFPDIYGTGEEDYANCAWWTNRYNSFPTHGHVGHDCYYRIHYPDVIAFDQSIDMEFEAWQNYYIASVVWYYSKDEPNLALTDQLDVGNAASEEQHHYRISGQTWSGEKTGVYPGKRIRTESIRDDGRAFDGFSEFRVTIQPENHGVRLRTRTEHINDQTVRVWIDGVLVTERPWAMIRNHYHALWVDSDFELPENYTRGKSGIRVKLEHVAQTPNWAEYRYEVFCYLQ